MGGIGTVLGDLARKIMPAAKQDVVDSVEREANDVVGAKDAYFGIGSVGEKTQQLHMAYQLERAKALTKLDAPVNLAQKAVLDHPELRKQGLDAPLGQLHAEATRLNHPIAAANGPLAELAARSKNAPNLSLKELSRQNAQLARTSASATVFGPKMDNVIPYIMPLLKSGDPTQEHWAKGILNLISNETRDTVTIFKDGEERQVSAAKKAVADRIASQNKGTILRGKLKNQPFQNIKNDLIPSIDTAATYKQPGMFERRVQNVLRVVQLPQVALKHISTVGNLSSIHAPQLVAGLLNMSDPAFKSFLDSTHILAYTEHDFMDRAMRGGSGTVAKLTGNPTAGQMFFRSYHMPFFDAVRSRQLSFAASVGWQASHNWAAQAVKGSRIAVENLKEMGINPVDVLKQGGKLTNEQLQKGVFHFVNNRFFMDKSIEQSVKGNSNGFWRSITMYHTFVNAQSRFFRRELSKMVRARDYVGLAQFAGTIGVLWPAVAPMMQSLELYGRTLNAAAAKQSAVTNYQNLTSGDPRTMAKSYIEMLSYYAAYGVYTNYIAAAHGNRMMYALAGPSIGVPARYSEDMLNFITRSNAAGKHNAAPVVRDTLEDFIPIAGNIMAHKIAPTAAEQKLGQGKRISHFKRRPKVSPDAKFEF